MISREELDYLLTHPESSSVQLQALHHFLYMQELEVSDEPLWNYYHRYIALCEIEYDRHVSFLNIQRLIAAQFDLTDLLWQSRCIVEIPRLLERIADLLEAYHQVGLDGTERVWLYDSWLHWATLMEALGDIKGAVKGYLFAVKFAGADKSEQLQELFYQLIRLMKKVSQKDYNKVRELMATELGWEPFRIDNFISCVPEQDRSLLYEDD